MNSRTKSNKMSRRKLPSTRFVGYERKLKDTSYIFQEIESAQARSLLIFFIANFNNDTDSLLRNPLYRFVDIINKLGSAIKENTKKNKMNKIK